MYFITGIAIYFLKPGRVKAANEKDIVADICLLLVQHLIVYDIYLQIIK